MCVNCRKCDIDVKFVNSLYNTHQIILRCIKCIKYTNLCENNISTIFWQLPINDFFQGRKGWSCEGSPPRLYLCGATAWRWDQALWRSTPWKVPLPGGSPPWLDGACQEGLNRLCLLAVVIMIHCAMQDIILDLLFTLLARMISLNCRLEQRLGQCFSVMGAMSIVDLVLFCPWAVLPLAAANIFRVMKCWTLPSAALQW